MDEHYRRILENAAIVESSDDAIVNHRLDGTIISWNEGAELMYGFSAEEALGRDLSLVVPLDGLPEANDVLQCGRGGEGWHHETVRKTRHGTLLDVHLTVSPVRDLDGQVVAISTIARDITEWHWLAKTLDARINMLEATLSHSPTSVEDEVRRFVANAGHQLRTPVAGIQLCAEALLMGPDADERDRLIAHLIRETARARRLIETLLRATHLDEEEPLSLGPCDIVDLCREEVGRAWVIAPQLDFVLRAEAPEGPLELDVNKVKEIVANLLDNARRHAVRQVQLEIKSDDSAVEIGVLDDGPGIPLEMAERVFERFVSLDNQGGSGLGLAIARDLARWQGGDVTYDADRRRFVVRLPLSRPEAGNARHGEAQR